MISKFDENDESFVKSWACVKPGKLFSLEFLVSNVDVRSLVFLGITKFNSSYSLGMQPYSRSVRTRTLHEAKVLTEKRFVVTNGDTLSSLMLGPFVAIGTVRNAPLSAWIVVASNGELYDTARNIHMEFATITYDQRTLNYNRKLVIHE